MPIGFDMSDSPKQSTPMPVKSRWRQWIGGAALALLVAAITVVAMYDLNTLPAADELVPPEAIPNVVAPTPPAKPEDDEDATIDDDGQTQWESPTDGPPLALRGIPPGVQAILAVRSKSLLAHPEAEKIVAALGPFGAAALREATSRIGSSPAAVDSLFIGAQIDREGNWQTSILDAANREPAPPLVRDMERLLAHTDASRDVTLLVRPNFLFGEGSTLFDGPLAALREPLFWFLGDNLAAVSLSLDWGDDFFIEFVGVPTLDVPTDRMAAELKARVNAMPTQAESFVAALGPSPYSRNVITRLPVMLRTLAAYTRTSYDRDVVELRAYLPVVAGHNLLMGTELALAEARGNSAPHSAFAAANSPGGVGERLKTVTSLRFPRDTLETALRMLSEDVGVSIVIRGADLQLEGITKNQSFAIDVTDRPAAEILVEILRLANPDKTSTGPNDSRQKLVYVVGPESPGGPEVVFVTTRARAADRGEALPEAFVAIP
jgi:hypothetical protein